MMFGLVCALLFLTDVAFGAVTITAPNGGTGTISLDEHTTTIYTVTATTTGTSIASYEIGTQNPTGIFAIATLTSGVITLISGQKLDYETTQQHTLTVVVKDDTTPTALSATATLTINVNNLNDVPAFGSSSYCAAVAADLASGSTIGTYTASDPDSPNTAPTYALTGDDTSTKFSYASSTGILTKSSTAFNTATKSNYALVLKATDTDGNIGSSTLTVTVGGTCSSAVTYKGVIAGIGTILFMMIAKVI